MKCSLEMEASGLMYAPSIMKSDIGFQAILRLFLRNLRGSNIGTRSIYFARGLRPWSLVFFSNIGIIDGEAI
jgi:hypothetical protein